MDIEFFSMLLKGYGYGGVFLISLIGASSIIFPIPSIAVIFLAGKLAEITGGIRHPKGY